MISSKGDRDGVAPKIKRLVSSAAIQIALRRNVKSGSKIQKEERRAKEGKQQKGEGKGKKKSVRFACLDEEEEAGPGDIKYRKAE